MNIFSNKFFRYTLLVLPVLAVTLISLVFLTSAPVQTAEPDGLVDNREGLIQSTDSEQEDPTVNYLLNVPDSRSEMVLPGWWGETVEIQPGPNDPDLIVLTSMTSGSRTADSIKQSPTELAVTPADSSQQAQAPITIPYAAPILLQLPSTSSINGPSFESVTVPPRVDDNSGNSGGGKGDSNNSGNGNSGSGSSNSGSGSGNSGSGNGNSGSGGENNHK